MKTIVIACGTGVVSSAIMNTALEELLRRHNIEARIIRCRYNRLEQYGREADLIVSSVPIPGSTNPPVVMGTALLTGRGTEELERDILKLLA